VPTSLRSGFSRRLSAGALAKADLPLVRSYGWQAARKHLIHIS